MSRLVTSEQAEQSGRPLVALNLCDVEQQARQAVERAKGEAKRLLTEAVVRVREMERLAVARGEKAGYDAGFQKGLAAGRAEALEAEKKRLQEATATIREALLEVLTEIEAQRHDVLADAKAHLLELAVAIAGRVCRARFDGSAEHVRPLLEEVIETTGRQAGLVLRIHPADLEAAEQFVTEIHGPLAGDSNGHSTIRLLADAQVERGGCVAERTCGKIDARIDAQVQRIVTELLGARVAADTGGARLNA